MPRPTDPHPARAWGWVAALRDGATTPWPVWLDDGADAAARGRALPGAAQLEVLRRLNAGGAVSPALAERVLTAVPTGRGSVEHVLGDDDPARLPVRELLGVLAGVTAETLAGRRPARVPTGAARLVAPPLLRPALWAGAAAGADADAVVVAVADPATMADHLWTTRALDGSRLGFEAWWQRLAGRSRPPRAADAARLVGEAVAEVGAGRVVVVPARSPALSPVEVEALRRVASPLRVLVPRRRRRRLLTTVLLPLLERGADDAGLRGLTTEVGAAWLAEHGPRARADLAAVLPGTDVRDGTPAALALDADALRIGSDPRPRPVLATLARALLALDGASDGQSAGEREGTA
ncbi:hypothetical protein GCM10023340_27220 [Nocardioides marinquilinus]|uniref:Uncharacterized protein n=1 Tax=Nocardioides marinquilinus TaxID=1210400 RepID=A0ABP9PR96_9ACTN